MLKRCENVAKRILEAAVEMEGCLICHRKPRPHGYCDISIYVKGVSITYKAHRLIYELIHGPIPPGLMILHSCDVRNCINPDHLSLGTNSDNMLDMHAKNRHKRGRNHNHAAILHRTMELLDEGRTQEEVAKIMGVTQSAISYRVKYASSDKPRKQRNTL